MRKLLSVSLVLAVGLLFGCQEKSDGALDTSKLEKVEPEGTLTDEMKKSVPVSYEASSLDEGLDALPFTLKVPNDLPFDAKPFEMMPIDDFKHDGKKLRVTLIAHPKDKTNKLLQITAHNFKVDYSGASDEVELSDGIVGSYSNGSLTFEKDGIYYHVEYSNERVTDMEEMKKDMLLVAEQLL